MLGAILVFVIGLNVRKLWPIGVLFLLVFAAASVAFGFAMRQSNSELLGETFRYDASSIGIAYGSTLLIDTIIFMIAFGIRNLVTRNRRLESKPKTDA